MAVPNVWRTKEQRYRLQGEVCQSCQRATFPPKRLCPHCHADAATPLVAEGAQPYGYAMLFDMSPIKELNVAGDD